MNRRQAHSARTRSACSSPQSGWKKRKAPVRQRGRDRVDQVAGASDELGRAVHLRAREAAPRDPGGRAAHGEPEQADAVVQTLVGEPRERAFQIGVERAQVGDRVGKRARRDTRVAQIAKRARERRREPRSLGDERPEARARLRAHRDQPRERRGAERVAKRRAGLGRAALGERAQVQELAAEQRPAARGIERSAAPLAQHARRRCDLEDALDSAHARLAKLPEELAHVVDQELRLLERGEVAACGRRPTTASG